MSDESTFLSGRAGTVLTQIIDEELAKMIDRQVIMEARRCVRDALKESLMKESIRRLAADIVKECEEAVLNPDALQAHKKVLVDHLTSMMGERLRTQMQVLVMRAIPEPPSLRSE